MINIQSLDLNRIKKNFFSHVYKLTNESIIQLLLPFFLIKFWGVANFGIWIILNSITIVLSLFLLKFNHGAQQEMTKELFQKNDHQSKIIFSNSLALVLINGLIFLIMISFLYIFFNENNYNLFNFFDDKDKNYYLVILILLTSILIKYVLSFYYHAIYNQQGELSVPVYIRHTLIFLSKISLIIFASLSNNFLLAALLLLLFDFLEWIFFIYLNTKNKIPFLFSLNLISKKELSSLFKKSIPNNIEIFNVNIHAHIGILLFGHFFSEEIVSFIVTAKVLFYYFPCKLLNSINSVFYFEYAKQIFTKNYLYLKKIIRFQYLITAVLSVVFIITTYLIGDFIYNFWIGHFNIEKNFMMAISFSALLIILVELVRTLAKSLNNYFLVTIFELFFTVIAIFGTYYLFVSGFSYFYYFYLLIIQYLIVLVIDLIYFQKLLKKYLKIYK